MKEVEIWRKIPHTFNLYQVSNLGRVMSFTTFGYGRKRSDIGRIVKPYITKQGYPVYALFLQKADKSKPTRIRKAVHLLMWEAFIGKIPRGLEIDHIDRNPKNNVLTNFRLATSAQNKANSKKALTYGGIPTSSKYRGISWSKSHKGWLVLIMCQGKQHYVGRYKDEEDAARAYNKAARHHFGKYANLNRGL